MPAASMGPDGERHTNMPIIAPKRPGKEKGNPKLYSSWCPVPQVKCFSVVCYGKITQKKRKKARCRDPASYDLVWQGIWGCNRGPAASTRRVRWSPGPGGASQLFATMQRRKPVKLLPCGLDPLCTDLLFGRIIGIVVNTRGFYSRTALHPTFANRGAPSSDPHNVHEKPK